MPWIRSHDTEDSLDPPSMLCLFPHVRNPLPNNYGVGHPHFWDAFPSLKKLIFHQPAVTGCLEGNCSSQKPPVDMAGQASKSLFWRSKPDSFFGIFPGAADMKHHLKFEWQSSAVIEKSKLQTVVFCFLCHLCHFLQSLKTDGFFKSKKCGTSKQPSCELVMATFSPESAAPETNVWSFAVVNPNFKKPKVHHYGSFLSKSAAFMSFTTSYHSSQQSVLTTFSCLGRLFHALFGGIPKSCEDAPFDTARLMAAGWDTVGRQGATMCVVNLKS